MLNLSIICGSNNCESERFSIECPKTKTKVITLANQKGQRKYSEPIKTRSNYTFQQKARENAHARVTIGFGSLLIGWKSGARNLNQSLGEVNAKPKQFANYFRHSIENRSITERCHLDCKKSLHKSVGAAHFSEAVVFCYANDKKTEGQNTTASEKRAAR